LNQPMTNDQAGQMTVKAKLPLIEQSPSSWLIHNHNSVKRKI
ncbi:hypothetical protein T11_8046, partial [Trichinella zimbabwensis]